MTYIHRLPEDYVAQHLKKASKELETVTRRRLRKTHNFLFATDIPEDDERLRIASLAIRGEINWDYFYCHTKVSLPDILFYNHFAQQQAINALDVSAAQAELAEMKATGAAPELWNDVKEKLGLDKQNG